MRTGAALGATLGLAFLAAGSARAASVTSNIPVDGSFSANVDVSGDANLNSASGTFQQWVPGPFGTGFHTGVGVSANSQSVGVTHTSTSNLDANGDGSVNLTYDDVTPGTPQELTQGGPPNAIDIDVNGSGGSNQPIPFDLAVDPLEISTSLGNFDLMLNLDGEISDLGLVSSTSTPITGSSYLADSTMTAVLNGDINATLQDVPIIGSVNLGTIFSLDDAPLDFAFPLPGNATLSDLGSGAFPHDMEANFAFDASGVSVPFPFTQPININESNNVPSGQSGFSDLQVDAELDAEITLSDVQYSYTGEVQNTLVPEPGTVALLGSGLLGLGLARRRRGR